MSHEINLAVFLAETGKTDEAQGLCTRALEKIRGGTLPEVIDIARASNLLGVIYVAQGRLEEAERCLLSAYRAWESVDWPTHPEAVGTLTNLAMVFIDGKRLQEAEPLCQKMASIVESAKGIGTQQLAACYNTIAVFYGDGGNLREAEKWFWRAYRTWKKAGWPAYPHSVRAIDNLAQNQHLQGKHWRADVLMERALVQHEQ